MYSVAGRKKSVASSSGLQIDTPPVAHNTFLNKAAGTSLYQQCSQLRARLMRINDFSPYFSISTRGNRASTDPVSQLWDCFALGIPLVFLYNLLPNVQPISVINTDPNSFDLNDDKSIKKAILHFSMALGKADFISASDQFRATELLNRNATDGFVKVVNCVTRLVDQLPEDRFQEPQPSSSPLTAQDSSDSLANSGSPVIPPPGNAQEVARNNIIRELVETERKYVQDLEHMQNYAKELSTSNAVDGDTIHHLFPGLSNLLNFQRRFLIRFESSAEQTWQDQRWGLHFTDCEDEFMVYEPYCANYTNAVDVMMVNEPSLMAVELINARSELPAFLIKPVQRICKYPLLLESLLKASSPETYPHYNELKDGLEAAKRITDRINEAQRAAENSQTRKSLEERVEDWKGHHLNNFGELLLDDVFMVTKMDIDREYHVFLFQRIILCCKETIPQTPNGLNKKGGKSNSILKKGSTLYNLPGGVGPPRKRNTPLALKGRIFLNNVTHARPSTNNGNYSLEVWWKGDDDDEYFTLRCRTEEQLKQWESSITRLIKETAERRRMEKAQNALSGYMQNSTSPAPQSRRPLFDAASRSSTGSSYLTGMAPPRPGPSSQRSFGSQSSYPEDVRGMSAGIPISVFSTGSGPNGYPGDDGLDSDEDFEEYPPAANNYPTSGRGTPLGGRRGTAVQSMMPEREVVPGYDRPRARTEDQNGTVLRQWRKNGQPVPPPVPPPARALPTPAGSMRASTPSQGYEAGYGQSQQSLRSKFSSNRLNSTYEDNGRSATPVMNGSARTNVPMRSRSTSQPSAYVPKTAPPPMPSGMWSESKGSMVGTMDGGKRGSGSSLSTSDNSDDSPHSSSPITPYGSSDSSLAGNTIRNARSQNYLRQAAPNGSAVNMSPMVKVKVHYHEDLFVIQVPRSTDYDDLMDRVVRKIRLCGPRREDVPLRVKYQDEDGDFVSIGSTEDVQLAFDSMRPANHVALFVAEA